MEVKRLVVEEPPNSLTVDFHAGLTIAFHENPVVRQRCLADLLAALGPGRAGLHLELVDGDRHHLAVFRPHGGRHRVVDIDAGTDVSARYRACDGRVDILGRLGLDPGTADRLLRLAARQIDRAPDTGTDDHRDARRLAGLAQDDLWGAAADLQQAEADLAAASQAAPGADVTAARAFEPLAAAHDKATATVARHRPIQRLGAVVTAACLLVGVGLLLVDDRIGDNGFTGRVLVVLGALAAGITAADRLAIAKARRAERAVLHAAGETSYRDAEAEAGALAQPGARRALIEASARCEAARRRWQDLVGETSPAWALSHRPAIEALADPAAVAPGVVDPGSADPARVLIDTIIHLHGVGATRERLPLLLDEPFAGQAPIDVQRLLSTLHRMAVQHQIVLVTGDPYVQAWATESAAAATVGFVRLGRTSSGGAAPAAPQPSGDGNPRDTIHAHS